MKRWHLILVVALIVFVTLALPVSSHAGRFFDGYSIASDRIKWSGLEKDTPKRTIDVQVYERYDEDKLREIVFAINAWADISRPYNQTFEMYSERMY